MMKVVALVNWGIGREVLNSLHAHPDVEFKMVLTFWEEPCRDPWRNVVRDRAAELGIPAFHAQDWPDAKLAAFLQNTDLMVTHAWPRRIVRSVFGAPRYGSVNIHPSLLPRHRGKAPHLRVMENRETETGLTCHLIAEGFDTGPIVAQMRVALQPDEALDRMLEKQKKLVNPLLEMSLARLQDRSYRPVPQDETLAIYAQEHERADRT